MGRLGGIGRVFFATLLLVVIVRAFFFSTFVIDGDSMREILTDGDHVLVNHFVYHLRPPQRGDIVVFEHPREDEILVKRVVAEPGEIVEIAAGVVYINGVPLAEPYLTARGGNDLAPQKVGTAEIFLLGDNRVHSNDSRDFGPVPKSRIRGRIVFVFWPPPQILDRD